MMARTPLWSHASTHQSGCRFTSLYHELSCSHVAGGNTRRLAVPPSSLLLFTEPRLCLIHILKLHSSWCSYVDFIFRGPWTIDDPKEQDTRAELTLTLKTPEHVATIKFNLAHSCWSFYDVTEKLHHFFIFTIHCVHSCHNHHIIMNAG